MGYFENISKTLPEFQGSNWLLRIPFAIVFIQQGFDKLPLNVEEAEGFNLPMYKIIEISKKNGDPKRFSCDIFIEGFKESSAFGKSHKQAETNAARELIERYINVGKI